MIEVTVETEIDHPVDATFAYLAEMTNNPTWMEGMHECVWTSAPPIQVGSTFDQVALFLGKKTTASFEVTEFEPGQRLRIESTGGPMPLNVARSFEPSAAGGTVIKAVVQGDPTGLSRLGAPMIEPMLRRRVAGDYDRLKQLLETR